MDLLRDLGRSEFVSVQAKTAPHAYRIFEFIKSSCDVLKKVFGQLAWDNAVWLSYDTRIPYSPGQVSDAGVLLFL